MKSPWKHFKLSLCLMTLVAMISNCTSGINEDISVNGDFGETYFELLDTSLTGVDFMNVVEDGQDFNILTYRNFYNGGGVAIGDINNDGFSDLYFTSNLQSNRLYLNNGDFTFKDITLIAGVGGGRGWSTGVTMADVNGDGWLDIYVSHSGDIDGDNKANELFVNNGLTEGGLPKFTEMAAAYGLDNRGFSIQAAFFDYDLDGDLDCYLLNNSFKEPDKIELFKSMRDTPDLMGGDKLYRNDLISVNGVSKNYFTDVSSASGIYSSAIGFGLGTCIGDVNGDMLPDIYVSNDFWERDYLYINKGGGHFSEELKERIDFCSISSMGGDIGDINNDGHPEIISTDMLAGDNYRLKAMSAFDPYHLEDAKYRANYHYQIGQNCLHLNDGTGSFQEIAMMSGVSATDWSWGALFFDFENDGRKDLFVSNGIRRDLMSLDFRDYMASNNLYKKLSQTDPTDIIKVIERMPSSPLVNYAFSNRGNLKLENVAEAIGMGQRSFSNGAAYGDLDNDGDMDLVVSNINSPPFIYKNSAERTNNHFLKVKFEGPKGNTYGMGAKVKIVTKDGLQLLENNNTRGFQSSIEPHLIFGLGGTETVDTIEVRWGHDKIEVLTKVSADQTITLLYQNATTINRPASNRKVLYNDVSAAFIKGAARHKENQLSDFDQEILLPSMLSTEGPRLLTGDVDGDELEDFIVFGAAGDPDKLFIQADDGRFYRKDVSHFGGSRAFESTCGVLLDFDEDGDLDLMIGSGGNDVTQEQKYFILRYYQNDGQGNFTVNNRNNPQVIGNFSCIEATDFDDDGDYDLFLGARVVPGNYGLPPRSFLFEYEGGRWQDRTPPDLAGAGMVTDACWSDIDGDEDEDLVVVGDWMGIKVFINEEGILHEDRMVPLSQGFWTRIEAVDLDADGDPDFVLGNRGSNTKLQASPQRPLSMYVNDFDRNGKSEFIIDWFPPLDQASYPFATKDELTSQLPHLKKQILKNEDYASATYETLFSEEIRKTSIAYQVTNLESSVLWNDGGRLQLAPLPGAAQVAPAYAIVAEDLDGDGHKDIWLGGNLYELKPQVGRHSASRGVFLMGDGTRQFRYISHLTTGLSATGQLRDAAVIVAAGQPSLIASRNNDTPVLFRPVE